MFIAMADHSLARELEKERKEGEGMEEVEWEDGWKGKGVRKGRKNKNEWEEKGGAM